LITTALKKDIVSHNMHKECHIYKLLSLYCCAVVGVNILYSYMFRPQPVAFFRELFKDIYSIV
jgi:hypothetical protein